MQKYLSLIVLASFTVLLAGCSKNSATASTRTLIDLVQSGSDIEFPKGTVLHVAKREGNSLEGIHIHWVADGYTSEITAEKGTIKPAIPDHSDYENQLMYNKTQITMTLYNAKNVAGTTNVTFVKQEIVLFKPN